MQLVYSFKEGNKDMRNILGGKGANLCGMTKLGLPVPTGIIVSTNACRMYYEQNENLTEDIISEIKLKIHELENETDKILGDIDKPLLVSVRSGSPVSMPGMMDTILNLGLNDEIVSSLVKKCENPRYIYDCYRRFIWMYSSVVMEIEDKYFEDILTRYKNSEQVNSDSELSIEALKFIIKEYKRIYLEKTNQEFPSDVYTQLFTSIEAVFKSWNNERAITYRRLNQIDDKLYTAVNIQTMVYGNLSSSSLTGVSFTRNPSTGENRLFGEYLVMAQGEDIVAGIRTPLNIEKLKDEFPRVYDELYHYSKLLEKEYKDMQDMEWTVEDSKLYILQTRNGKRNAQASVKIALDLLKENIIEEKDLIERISIDDIKKLLYKRFDEQELSTKEIITTGLNAGAGASVGRVYFTAKDIVNAYNNGITDLILVREETSPEDIEGMNYASGILTVRGGMTSHAAVVARGMGKCCICGASNITINEEEKIMIINGHEIKEGDYLSLDGTKGRVYLGKISLIDHVIDDNIKNLIVILNKYNKLQVMANADSPKDATVAINYGANGIGLCRTEHMFFDKDRIFEVRKMILAKTESERKASLDILLPIQMEDFYNMFKVMDNKQVTIRYIDPPLHEFLPKEEEKIRKLALALNISYEEITNRINELKEFNPMMGHRGCRLFITYPEILVMQTKAIIKAAIKAFLEGIKVKPELMIPLIVDLEELKYIKNIIIETINNIFDEQQIEIEYEIGTMIETPRACLLASKIAREVDFFSFGTNDLTQLTYGFSRDDASKYLNSYYEKNIFKTDPFVSIDNEGVLKLLMIAVIDGRNNNPNISLGICGEHGGDEQSINDCFDLGLNYVSCSPYRVLMAKLISAKKQIKE